MWGGVPKNLFSIDEYNKTIVVIYLKFLSWIYMQIINFFNDVISVYRNRLSEGGFDVFLSFF